MKSIFPILVFLIFSLEFGFTQNEGQQTIAKIIEEIVESQNKLPTNYNYYYYHNRVLKDIRDNSVIIENLPDCQEKFLQDGGFVLHYSTYRNNFVLDYYDSNNKLIKKTTGTGYLSPDWNYIITIKEGDLWYDKVDFRTGKISGQKKLTELGVFRGSLEYSFWHKNKIGLDSEVTGGSYVLDVSTGEIVETAVPIYIGYKGPSFRSPNGRYVNLLEVHNTIGQGPIVYDVELNKVVDLDLEPVNGEREVFSFWANNDIYISRIFNNYNGTLSLRFTNVVTTDVLDVEVYNREETGKDKNGGYYESCKFPINLYSNERFSRLTKLFMKEDFNQKHILFEQGVLSWDGIQYDEGFEASILFNFENGEKVMLEKQRIARNYEFKGVNRVWVRPDVLVYSTSGDILKQGTWLYNAETGEKKKITPFVGTSFWSFKNTEYFMFVANGKLYQCNKDGNNLKVVDEKIDRFTNISLFRGTSYFDKVR